jgi:hypothetical protein
MYELVGPNEFKKIATYIDIWGYCPDDMVKIMTIAFGKDNPVPTRIDDIDPFWAHIKRCIVKNKVYDTPTEQDEKDILDASFEYVKDAKAKDPFEFLEAIGNVFESDIGISKKVNDQFKDDTNCPDATKTIITKLGGTNDKSLNHKYWLATRVTARDVLSKSNFAINMKALSDVVPTDSYTKTNAQLDKLCMPGRNFDFYDDKFYIEHVRNLSLYHWGWKLGALGITYRVDEKFRRTKKNANGPSFWIW